MTVGIALAPFFDDGLESAVREGGGEVVGIEEADGLVWTNPLDPNALKDELEKSPARWVQLPFAGIESFVAAGVLDPARTWTCTKGAYGPSTAEHALALVLAGARHLHEHARAKTWRVGGLGAPERRLTESTVVVIGTGGIGSALTEMLQPLGATVIGVNRSGRPLDGAVRTVPASELRDVLPEADFVVVAASSTPETDKIIGEPELAAMKEGAWLVNVARGRLVDTEALLRALDEDRLGGAALDVTDPEPLPDGHPLWDHPRAIVTPHVANTWDMAVPLLREVIARNVAHFAAGEPLEGEVDVVLGY